MIYGITNKNAPWGDWGDILWSGFAPFDETTHRTYVERTGPFTPPLYIASSRFIFTDAAKQDYEKAGLGSLNFPYTLEKRKIVRIEWASWDKSQSFHAYVEDVMEPEDLIEGHPHDPELAQAMANLWLAEPQHEIHIAIDRDTPSRNRSDYLSLRSQPPDDWDFMAGIGYGGFFISQRVKDWLDEHYSECFETFPIQYKPSTR